MSQTKQTQSAIDKFLKDMDDVNKEFESLYNSKIKFSSQEDRQEYDKLHDEIANKMQEILTNFKNNRY